MKREWQKDGYGVLRFGSPEAAKRSPGIVVWFLCFDRKEAEQMGKRMASVCTSLCFFGTADREPDQEGSGNEPDFSPWTAPGIWNEEPLQGGGMALLKKMESEFVPEAEAFFELSVTKRYLVGYSLAGLCALIGAYETTLFDGTAAVSGSLWLEGFEDYYRSHSFGKERLTEKKRKADPEKTGDFSDTAEAINAAETTETADSRNVSPFSTSVYLSVGAKEKNTRNPRMQRVESSMEAYREYLLQKDPSGKVTLEINPGTHFTDPEGRMRRAAEWLIGTAT